MDDARIIEVGAFGGFSVHIDGEPAPAIKSRFGRELLLFVSLRQGTIRRDELVDVLLPEASDHRLGRRRLTKEMSRVQSTLGIALWETTPQTVAVRRDIRLTSDLNRFLNQQPQRLGDGPSIVHQLASDVRLTDEGPVLLGHDSQWSTSIRAQATDRELAIRQELVAATSASDPSSALDHARRWAELDPFVDDAHRTVLNLTHTVLGSIEAQQYLNRWTELYRSELGFDPPEVPLEISNERPESRPALRRQISDLERELGGVSDPIDQWNVLIQLDDVLRIVGDGSRRRGVLDRLTELSTNLDCPSEVTWRQAEFALYVGETQKAEELLFIGNQSDRQGGSPGRHGAGKEAVTRSQVYFYLGQCGEAIAAAEDAIRSSGHTDPATEIEARLWISRAWDHTGDNGAARKAALHALDLARQLGLDHYIADALAAVGWCLVRTDHAGEAQFALDEATEIADRIGCDLVRATALGALGGLHYMNRKPATSYVNFAAAAELSRRIGHMIAFSRWAFNAMTPQLTLGGISQISYHVEQLRALPSTRHDPGLQARLLYIEGWAALCRDRPQEALASSIRALGYLDMVDEPVQRLYTRTLQTFALWECGRTSDAVEHATGTLEQARKHNLPPYLAAGFDVTVGCALVKDGSTTEGMELLSEFMAHRNPGQILDAIEYGVFFEAASQLNMVDECAALARTTCRMVDNLRQDLTQEQWEIAKKQSYYVRCILPVLDSVGYR